jgi:hypothetical protein
MRFNKRFAGTVMGIGLLLGSVGGGAVLAQGPTPISPPAAVQSAPQPETGPGDQVQEPSYTCSLAAGQQATISAADAETAVLAANPGTTVVKTELDDENGCLVYAVELSNGSDVKVDAGNGTILYTEQAGADHEATESSEVQGKEDANDQDNVQEQHESQVDDASESPGVEDAAVQ